MPPALDLPDDIQTLKQLLLEERAARQVDRAEIASLKLQLSYLKRQQFGQSSEQLSEKIAQLELTLEDLEAAATTASCRRQSRRCVRRAYDDPCPRSYRERFSCMSLYCHKPARVRPVAGP